jgi:hypothetical protein
MDNVQNCDSYINIHRHKPIDRIFNSLSLTKLEIIPLMSVCLYVYEYMRLTSLLSFSNFEPLISTNSWIVLIFCFFFFPSFIYYAYLFDFILLIIFTSFVYIFGFLLSL